MSIKNIYRILFLLLCIQVAFYVLSLFGRATDIDDAWLGEISYWMSKEGHARSELMRGCTMQENRILIHHKLLTLHGAAFIKVFGFSVYILKAVSLLYFLLFYAVFSFYTLRHKKILNRKQFVLASLLIFSYHYLFKFSFIFRPEVMIMFLSFISFILLEKIIRKPNSIIWTSLAAGVLGGLCGVAHLNGIAVAAAGAVLLLWNRDWKAFFIYTAGAIMGISVYFYDFTKDYGFHFWKSQLFDSIMGSGTDSTDIAAYLFNNLLKEHMRFFHDLTIIPFSLLIIVTLFAGFKYLVGSHKTMAQYTLLLWLFIAIAFTQKSRQYTLIYFPYMVIFLTLTLDKLIHNQHGLAAWVYTRFGKIIMLPLFIFFYIGTNIYNIRTYSEQPNTESNRCITIQYIAEDPSTLKIVAPMEFIFNEIEYYKRIQGERFYTTMQKLDTSINGRGFLKKANEFDIDYIILSPVYRQNLGVENMREGDTMSDFRLIHYSENLSIYKHKMLSIPNNKQLQFGTFK